MAESVPIISIVAHVFLASIFISPWSPTGSHLREVSWPYSIKCLVSQPRSETNKTIFMFDSSIISVVAHCGFNACHLDKPSSSTASSIKPTCELTPVFVRLGGSIGAPSSSTREFCAALLVGGNGGGVAVFLPLAGEDRPCGEPVIRRGGGCMMLLTDAGEALFVRLGAGGGGATEADTGGC